MNMRVHYPFTLEYFSSNYFFEIISYQNYIICRFAIFGMIYFQRTVAKWYFAEWHISKHFFAESRLRNIWLPNSLFPNFQFPNIFCRIVLPYGSVAECLFCRMVFCRMCFLRNIVAEWPTLNPVLGKYITYGPLIFSSQIMSPFILLVIYSW